MASERRQPPPKLVKYSDIGNSRSFLISQIFRTVPSVIPENIDNPEIHNRTIIVTGANSGLGLEAAKQLSQLECVSRLILACRDLKKASNARQNILNALPESKRANMVIETWELDMASKASIAAFAQRTEELDRIDAIVLNAGVNLGTQYVKASSSEGPYEMTLMVNVIGTMMLAILMVPILRRKSNAQLMPRISIVGSAVQFFVRYQVLLDAAYNQEGQGIFEWLSNEERWQHKTEDQYFLSKGILQMLVQQLAARVPIEGSSRAPVIVNCVAPGYCRTDFFKTSATFGRSLLLKFIGREPDVGGRNLVIGAVGQAGGLASHGKYMSEGEVKAESEWFQTEQGREIGKRMWEEMCEIIKRASGPGAVDL